MTTAYFIAGAPSSGNRMLTAALVRAGCAGEGSTEQPHFDNDFKMPQAGARPYVMFGHPNSNDVKARTLTQWVEALREHGYTRIVVIFLIREPIAHARSCMAPEHNHNKTEEEASAVRLRILRQSFGELDRGLEVDQVEVVTYEGITEEFLKEWLPRIGLQYAPGELYLPGQHAPTSIQNQNSKHYGKRP